MHGLICWFSVGVCSFPCSRFPRASLMTHSPLLPARGSKSDHKHIVESIVLIPALTVKAHYQSILRSKHSTSPHHSLSSSPLPPATTHQTEMPPVKRGILSLSTVIESLPEDIKLTPSFLDFIEQVAKPTLAATVVSSSSSSESLTDEAETNTAAATMATAADEKSPAPISFPVDVTLTFHIQPSTVCLTCQPHSQVECIIQSPDVNFVISFSLFSHQVLDGSSSLNSSSPNCSTTGTNPSVIPFNNLYITGCLTTFVLQLYCPQVSSLKPAAENKEALSLTLGQALVHFSRKSVLAAASRAACKPATSVDDYTTTNKMQVSGKCVCVCVCVCQCGQPELQSI